MLRKAETLEGTLKQIRSARAQEGGNVYGCEDDPSFEEIRDEVWMIIRLLTTESPTFGSE